MTSEPKVSSESSENEYAEILNRLRQEPAIAVENSTSSTRPEPTLAEAREDLARAVGDVAHSIFAKKYGPMVSTVTKATIEAVLKDLEKNAYRAKTDGTLIAQELLDRAISKRRNKKA
jgi:hypothetical protein